MTPRALARLAFMIAWLALCVPAHLIVRALGPSPWPRRFLRGIGWIAGARVTTRGAAPGPGTLIVANHVSWLDIPILAGATDCAFVAKDGLKGHPLMRWLCEQNGSVFVDRDDRGGIADQVAAMQVALRAPKPLCLFPEGTVGDGTRLLPFRSSLLKLAEHPPEPITIRPVAIDYGLEAPDFGWPDGESGRANFIRILGRRGTVAVRLHFLEPLSAGQNRKAIARSTQDAIERTLSLPIAAAPGEPVPSRLAPL